MIQVYEHYDTYEHALSQALTDWFFACPARRTVTFIYCCNFNF